MRGAVAFGIGGAHSCAFGAEPSQRFVSGTQRFVSGTQRFVSGTHICAFGAEPSRHLEIPIHAREHQRQLAFLIRARDGRPTGTQRSRLLEIVIAHLPYREAITAHQSHSTGTPNLASSRSSSHTASVRSTSTFHASSEVISGHQRSSEVIRGHQHTASVRSTSTFHASSALSASSRRVGMLLSDVMNASTGRPSTVDD
jgi:hypothetical protein